MLCKHNDAHSVSSQAICVGYTWFFTLLIEFQLPFPSVVSSYSISMQRFWPSAKRLLSATRFPAKNDQWDSKYTDPTEWVLSTIAILLICLFNSGAPNRKFWYSRSKLHQNNLHSRRFEICASLVRFSLLHTVDLPKRYSWHTPLLCTFCWASKTMHPQRERRFPGWWNVMLSHQHDDIFLKKFQYSRLNCKIFSWRGSKIYIATSFKLIQIRSQNDTFYEITL